MPGPSKRCPLLKYLVIKKMNVKILFGFPLTKHNLKSSATNEISLMCEKRFTESKLNSKKGREKDLDFSLPELFLKLTYFAHGNTVN